MKIIISIFFIFFVNISYAEMPNNDNDNHFQKFIPYIEKLNDIKKADQFNDKIICESDYFYFDLKDEFMKFIGKSSLFSEQLLISAEQIMIKFNDKNINFISEPNSYVRFFNKDNNSIEIRSNKVTFNYIDKKMNLYGANRVNYQNCFLSCDEMQLLLSNNLDLKEFYAKSNINLKMKDFILRSKFATFYSNMDKIDLYGNPIIKNLNNNITAENILIWPMQERILCRPKAEMIISNNF